MDLNDRATRAALTVICGLVIAAIALVAHLTDTEKHEQQRDIRQQIETVSDIETGWPTVTTTQLVPYVGTPN